METPTLKIDPKVELESCTILQSNEKIWLEVSNDGEVNIFDEEEMRRRAAEGCAYAKAFSAFYDYARGL